MFRVVILAAFLNSALAFSLSPFLVNNFHGVSHHRAALITGTGSALAFRKPSALTLRAQDSSLDDKTAGAIAAVSFVALPVMLWSEFTLK